MNPLPKPSQTPSVVEPSGSDGSVSLLDRRRWLAWAGAGTAALGLAACRRPSLAERCAALGAGGAPAHHAGPQAGARGLDFPGSAGVLRTMRFRFFDPLPMYPATYLWRALPRRQKGYYTAFFWGNDDGKNSADTFMWLPGRVADSYYGAHPYPDAPPHGDTHQWEISIEQHDFVNGAVDYDRWHTQAFRAWGNALGKHHEFYWDLPLQDACRRVQRSADRRWGERRPPVPALTWGDAPWAPGKEVWNGVLRGLQIYTTRLEMEDVLAELERPLSTPAGARHIWYLNLDPTPDDIRDRSGRGHHPHWVGDERPALWRG